VNTAKTVLDSLIKDGRVVRGWLGMGIQNLTGEFQEYYGVTEGVVVASVDENSPAAKAGIVVEDVIIKVGDTAITEVRQLQRLIASTNPGSDLAVTVSRNGHQQTIQVKVGLSPATPKGRPNPDVPSTGTMIRVRTLSNDLAGRIGLKGVKGTIVVDVQAGSPAECGGLDEGDIITSMNGRAITSEKEFNEALGKTKLGSIVVLRVVRKGTARLVGFRTE
jgi:serine protease Do